MEKHTRTQTGIESSYKMHNGDEIICKKASIVFQKFIWRDEFVRTFFLVLLLARSLLASPRDDFKICAQMVSSMGLYLSVKNIPLETVSIDELFKMELTIADLVAQMVAVDDASQLNHILTELGFDPKQVAKNTPWRRQERGSPSSFLHQSSLGLFLYTHLESGGEYGSAVVFDDPSTPGIPRLAINLNFDSKNDHGFLASSSQTLLHEASHLLQYSHTPWGRYAAKLAFLDVSHTAVKANEENISSSPIKNFFWRRKERSITKAVNSPQLNAALFLMEWQAYGRAMTISSEGHELSSSSELMKLWRNLLEELKRSSKNTEKIKTLIRGAKRALPPSVRDEYYNRTNVDEILKWLDLVRAS